MNPMIFYVGALVLCGHAFVLIRQAALKSQTLVPARTKKANRRLVGRMLLGIAASFAGLGLLAQALSNS